ncbi:MAG: TonB-dependent receptor [Leptolyngbya sp. SIO1D8]|nr:TonB-dependent receptor [Leptolyngbya sp. SIO1D8]
MTSQRHIIRQQILDLHVEAETQAFELQNQLSALYRSKIIPLIETFCDRLSDPDTIHRIDTLEIDLGEIDLNTLETDFVQKVAASLHEQLTQRLAFETISSRPVPPSPSFTPPSSTLSPSSVPIPTQPVQPAKQPPTNPTDAHFELFRDFLQTGRLPWWCEPLDQSNLEKRFTQLLTDTPEKLKELLQNSLKQTKILQRLVYQFSESMLMDILKLIVPTWHPLVHHYLRDIDGVLFSANLTLLDSDTFYPVFSRQGTDGSPLFTPLFINTERPGAIPGQPDLTANIALGYEKGGFSGRVSVILQDQSFDELGTQELKDTFTNFSARWDATVKQDINDRFQVFLNWNNITNEPQRSFQSNLDDETEREFFGATVDLGLRVKLFK